MCALRSGGRMIPQGTQTLYRKPFPRWGRPDGLKVYRRVRSARNWAHRHKSDRSLEE